MEPRDRPFLPARYSAGSLERKHQNAKALRDRFWLREADGPVVAFVGGLDEQKGMHLVHHALFYTLARRGQFVLIGDAGYHDGFTGHFWHLERYLNDNPDCLLEISYREDLARLVYAGADLVAVPTMFEPCGLAPLIAMRYGDGAGGEGDRRDGRHLVFVPVVNARRAIGGARAVTPLPVREVENSGSLPNVRWYPYVMRVRLPAWNRRARTPGRG